MTFIRLQAGASARLAAWLGVLGLAVGSAGGAAAHPGGGSGATPNHQHPEGGGHLFGTGAWGNMQLVGKLTGTALTPTPGEDMVADVAVSPDGKWAFLANWGRPTCAANSEAGDPDAGAWVIDIANPANPRQVGFIAHSQDSRPGEGMQVVPLKTKAFEGWVLVMNNEQCGKNGKGGVSLFDVTDPLKPVKLSEHFGDRGKADTNEIHSAFAWQAGANAYVVMTDNAESTDVDILDITNPKRPRLVAEYNLNEMSRAAGNPVDQPELELQDSSLHDMVVKYIAQGKYAGKYVMLVSYWDGGYVLLDVTNPAAATILGDTDYAAVDPELFAATGASVPPEGNGHEAEFTVDNRFFIATDEDFSPYRQDFTIDTGANAGKYPAGEFGWTLPVLQLPDKKLNGPTVFGGYGCPDDRAEIPNATDVFPTVQPGEERIIVFQRGPEADPSHSHEACFFSEKVESGQLAGYDAVIVANHHNGAQGGAAPDAAFCGGQGHEFTITASGVCIGHRAMHLLFSGAASYAYPESQPAVGAVGEHVSFTPRFDGWGYVHLFDANTLKGLDTFAIPEAHDEARAFGFGDLTVHEVATHRALWNRAYLSYYAGGMRALEIRCGNRKDTSACKLVETGGYLDPHGNDFWGVETFQRDADGDGKLETYILGSDMDSGLWIFRDTTAP
jgi:hypothetical protein